MATVPTAVRQDRYSVERATFGGITFVTMHGTLNEAFEGRKFATGIRTKKILVNMRDVRRFASWGMSEWMDFLRICGECDVYLIECSTYAVSQLNLVTGLLGHAKLVSFYASYRCGGCSEELESLFLIPRDRPTIPDIPNTQHDCPTCGGHARLEEYPAAFFETIAARPVFDIDDEALAFMRSHLKYDLSPDLTRFRALRRTLKDYTYLRFSGGLGTLPSSLLAQQSVGTTVVDLEGIVFDPSQLNPWQAYVKTAMPGVKSLQLVNCPWGFLEAAIHFDQLADKLKVRTFAQSYECLTCDTKTIQPVDVAEHLEELVGGTVPPARCLVCRSALLPVLPPNHVALLRALPARDRDVALDNFLRKARSEPADKLENALVLAKPSVPAVPTGRLKYFATALTLLLVAALVVVGFELWKQRNETEPVAIASPVVTPPAKPAFSRPDWILSEVPSSAYCHDMINRLMCVGVSAYRPSREEGVEEATDAALEELVAAVGLKISDRFFRESVMSAYSDVRTKALAAVQAPDPDRASDPRAAAAYAAADEVVRKGRRRVVEVLRASGGAAVPAQRADWYWEEYAKQAGKGTEFLVFVRFDVTLDAVRGLVDKYSVSTPVVGSTAMTAFPALAWQHATFNGGALLTKIGRPLGGLAPKDIVVAVGEQRVTDAPGLARQLEDGKDRELKLSVETGDAPARVVVVHR
jgi:DNA-directed RNA polymerase subunit RPC12/RpoP